MTDQEKRKAAAAIFTAAANGERIEWLNTASGAWNPCDPFDPTEGARQAVFRRTECFRIAPKPVTREWKPEEVPVGAVIKSKSGSIRTLITHVYSGSVRIGNGSEVMLDYLFANYTLADGSPCGVTE